MKEIIIIIITDKINNNHDNNVIRIKKVGQKWREIHKSKLTFRESFVRRYSILPVNTQPCASPQSQFTKLLNHIKLERG